MGFQSVKFKVWLKWAIRSVVLDNHSAHVSKETMKYLASRPGRFVYVYTPKHGSWLNLIDTAFSKMARTFLKMQCFIQEGTERAHFKGNKRNKVWPCSLSLEKIRPRYFLNVNILMNRNTSRFTAARSRSCSFSRHGLLFQLLPLLHSIANGRQTWDQWKETMAEGQWLYCRNPGNSILSNFAFLEIL